MNQIHSGWQAREQRRWLRNDAHRWLRPDHARFEKPQRIERKYNPNQPRVPAGNRDGGQWTSGSSDEGAATVFPFILPDLDGLQEEADFALLDEIDETYFEDFGLDSFIAEESEAEFSSTRRRSGTHFINGQWLEATPAQAARYEAANARAREAIGRVRVLDPNWRPAPSAYGIGIESEISRANGLANEAQSRITDLSRVGIGPGPFAGDSISARSSGRNFTTWEREEITRIGRESGCHTCGTTNPGTLSGRFVVDHQLPNALNSSGLMQRLYPQCATCSARQGGWLGHRGHSR